MLAHAVAAAVRVALRGADRHVDRLRDLLERVAERVLQHDYLRLLRRDTGKRVAQLAAQLRHAGDAVGVAVRSRPQVVRERFVAALGTPLGGVATRVDHEPVQPGRELRVAAELLQPYAELRERLLGRIASVLGIAEEMTREPLDLRRMSLAEGRECKLVAVFCARDEDRIAQLLVVKGAVLPEGLPDGLHNRPSLKTVPGRFGQPYRFVESCPSTQKLLLADDPEGAVVATDHQTDGRGRFGRVWVDTPGRSLLFSLLLRPIRPMPDWPELSVIAAEAVAAALPLEATVLHPNDVMVGDRKVAGILPEASDGRVVLGIGVNVNQTADELPADARKPSTSLRLELGHEVERTPLLAAILLELEARYDARAGVS